jgi:hypothetical protein
MKLTALLLLFCINAAAQRNLLHNWPVSDTTRAVSFYTELVLYPQAVAAKNGYAGIVVEGVGLEVETPKKSRFAVSLTVPKGSSVIASGTGVKQGKGKLSFPIEATPAGAYKLLLVKAYDSAQHFSLLSGYAFLPHLQKWKLVGTVRKGGYGFIKEAATVSTTGRKRVLQSFSNTALLRGNNSGRNRDGAPVTIAVPYWRDEADSAGRALAEQAIILGAIGRKETPALQAHQGIYYHIQTPGAGRQVKVTDTLTVYYKGYLFGDSTAVFDQTAAGKPARFPLNNLIPGWKIGLPLLNTGGKIMLVIPSGLAYSIRTRSAKIPPNSILVFEIEVLKAE